MIALLTAREVAEILGVSVETALRWARAAKFGDPSAVGSNPVPGGRHRRMGRGARNFPKFRHTPRPVWKTPVAMGQKCYNRANLDPEGHPAESVTR